METHRYVADPDGFLWPASVQVESWGVHRTFGRGSELSLSEVPVVEIANAVWVLLEEGQEMTEEQLFEALLQRLDVRSRNLGFTQSLNNGLNRGLQALPEGVRRAIGDAIPEGWFGSTAQKRLEHRLYEGVQEGLVTGRLQRQANGTIRRFRIEWPTTYRS